MNSIEELAKMFPDKTGAELFAIQKQDKLDLIDEINQNGAYYRGHFSYDHIHYYRVTNAVLVDDAIVCEVESIGINLGDDFSIEKITRPNREISDYGYFKGEERVTEKEWNELVAYIKGVEQFKNN